MNLPEYTKQIQGAVGAKQDGFYGVETARKILAYIDGVEIKDLPISKTDRVDARSEKVIASLQAAAQPYMRTLIKVAEQHGMTVKALSGFRSYAEQEQLYKAGKVTKAPPGHSGHNFGIACDFGIFKNGKYLDNEVDKGNASHRHMDAEYSALGAWGRALGLSWGGDWKNFKDMPHFYFKPDWADRLNEDEMMAELRSRHDNKLDYYV